MDLGDLFDGCAPIGLVIVGIVALLVLCVVVVGFGAWFAF
jgi:hypothetical protein